MSVRYFNLALFLLGFFQIFAATTFAGKPNVLLIAIDDMNDWASCLGGHPDGKTPNIDRFARRGTLFTNAHCQAPICNPSRTSVMYGLRPSSSGVYGNGPFPWKVAHMQDYVTLPRWFARNGYVTATTGKIYHSSGLPDGDFDIVGPRPGQRMNDLDERLRKELSGLWDFGPQRYDETLFQDHVDATWAIQQLQELGDKPFFLAVGFYRPHVPFYAPTRVFEQVPRDSVTLPPVKDDDWNDIPPIAHEVTFNEAPPPHSWFVENDTWKDAVQAYLACIRWTDEQVGRVLDALAASQHADDTVVILYSD
ncbi:MAG: sulfatase-like hydrolase/transferase, partial [Verrucomicrobiae bacterium]|nr:sulfatase-like hydrolase/transferase [Verrucomicrobiae bacterium]